MTKWASRGLSGSALEEMINYTNEEYRKTKLALIQKIPTPITPVEMNKARQITLAYFDQKSTVDYIGVIQEVPVCFDAKECATDTFPLQNVHEHQISFMRDFEKQGGVAFFVLFYTSKNKMYYMTFGEMDKFWKRMENGGRKSFRFEELEDIIEIVRQGEFLCHYLTGFAADVASRPAAE